MMKWIVLILCFCLQAEGVSQTIEHSYKKYFGTGDYQGASISIKFQDLASAESEFSVNEHLLVIPASALKLYTTAAALNVLGPNFKFQTTVYLRGEIIDGVLFGDLIVRGIGDPTFCSESWGTLYTKETVFNAILSHVKNKGIRRISGKIVVDASFMDTSGHRETWSWEDIGNYYGAGNWGLNFNENQYHLYFNQNEIEGKHTSISHVEPDIPSFRMNSEVRTGPKGSGDQAYIFSSEHSNHGIVRGTIPPGQSLFKIKGSIPNPPAAFAFALAQYLNHEDIMIDSAYNVAFEPYSGALKPLVSFESPALIDVITKANQKSNNLYCESLLDYLRIRENPDQKIEEFLKVYWQSEGVNLESATLLDGSGLSPRNTLSAKQFVKLLESTYSNQNFQGFKQSLSEAGVNGTTKSLFKNSSLKGRMWLKSGSMQGVCTYAGYLEKKNGSLIAFAVLINNAGKSNALVRRDIRAFLEFVYAQK